MFYSPTYLARKGPLGTVWCAAHLQHKLKRSHYTSTKIEKTVELITCPEVPIALRMSSHLLLGIVRIYSKKVDYCYQDCNVLLMEVVKVFSSVNTNINLPEGATQAPYHAITLPDTLALDAMELDDYFDLERSEDNHHGRKEDITFEDQVPIGRDSQVLSGISKDNEWGLPVFEEATTSRLKPMEEDSRPFLPEEITAVTGDHSPTNQGGLTEKAGRDSTPQELPEIEIMRDAVHDFQMEDMVVLPDQGYEVLEAGRVLEEQTTKHTVASSPVLEEILVSGGPCPPLLQPEEPQSVSSAQFQEDMSLDIPLRDASLGLVMRASPPVEQPRARQGRRRRVLYDRQTVLTNEFMKKALEDSSNLLRKKRSCPSSSLEMWKSHKRLMKDTVFFEPLITGLSANLVDIYKKESISSKPHSVVPEEPHPLPKAAQPPTSWRDNDIAIERGRDNDIEIERLCNNEGPSGGNVIFNTIVSSPTTSMASRRCESTPAATKFGSERDPVETIIGTDVLLTPDFGQSSGFCGSDMDTPTAFLGGTQRVDNSVLSDIPEMGNSAGDLNFLDQDENTPRGTPKTPQSAYPTRGQVGTPEFDKMSARTRAVAQYLRGQSSVASSSEESAGSLSLNSILDGKTRKICARMFYETLVLNNYKLVDVKQDEPYGDIFLKVTSKLIKEKFPS